MFQFLIGRLGTLLIFLLKGLRPAFQFLIGRLGTRSVFCKYFFPVFANNPSSSTPRDFYV